MVYRLNNRNNYSVLNEGIGENLYPTLGEIDIFVIIIFFPFYGENFIMLLLFFFFLYVIFTSLSSPINGRIFYSVDIYFIALSENLYFAKYPWRGGRRGVGSSSFTYKNLT